MSVWSSAVLLYRPDCSCAKLEIKVFSFSNFESISQGVLGGILIMGSQSV